jgi:hypothetical protein
MTPRIVAMMTSVSFRFGLKPTYYARQESNLQPAD